GFLPHGAVSGVGEWPVRAEGARSGGPPSVDGGFLARFARAPSRPSAVLPRSTSVPRGRSPFVRAPSRPLAVLPRFTAVSRGRSPVDPVSLGFLPHGAVSGVGEWPVRAEGARSGGPP